MEISRRVNGFQGAAIQEIFALLKENRGAMSLGQGVPFFGPPPEALDALSRLAAASGPASAHLYGPDAGQDSLRKALSDKLRLENRIEADPSRGIMVTCGDNQAFFNVISAVADPGDEIIIFRPYYFNHEMAIRMAGCVPVEVPIDPQTCLPGMQLIQDAISPRTRAIVTVSPTNPTGAVWPEALLRAINNLCMERGLAHVSDETYEYFIHGSEPHFSPGSIRGASGHTFSLFSLSKSLGMAGWRLGYMAHPTAMHEAFVKVQDTLVICPPVLLQEAAELAVPAGRAWVGKHMADLARSRQIAIDGLAGLEEKGILSFARTTGAYYLYVTIDPEKAAAARCEQDRRMDSWTLARRLIREHGIAIVPGSTFGMGDLSFRLSHGNLGPAKMEEAMDRLCRGLTVLLG